MKKIIALVIVLSFLAALAPPKNVGAGADPFLGEIMMVGFTFCPRGWAECNGQLLPISQNTALYALLGTTYGGDGITTFGLPDLRGRVPIHTGQGPGLTNRPLGSVGGYEENFISVDQLPAHSHPAWASTGLAWSTRPGGKVWARGRDDTKLYRPPVQMVQMDQSAIGETGQGDSVGNMQPYLVIRSCIAIQGLFPSRP